MTPEFNFMFEEELTNETMPSYTYKLDLVNKRIYGHIDELQAIKQAIFKILNTERYLNVIYSANYGVELERFIGKNLDFIKSDLQRTLEEALKADDRINGISDFEILEFSGDKLLVKYTVNTILGDINLKGGVKVE